MPRFLATVLLVFACSAAATAQPPAERPAAPPLDWQTLESPFLTNQLQLTTRDKFVKAGEAYFGFGQTQIIFQAVAVAAAGNEPDPFYAMYTGELRIGSRTGSPILGLDDTARVSPEGSANTCGWLHPTEPWRLMFGSTLVRPSDDQKSGFQVGTRKYVWMFPQEMEIVSVFLRGNWNGYWHPQEQAARRDGSPEPVEPALPNGAGKPPAPIFTRPNYDAECSYSADGRFILYAHIEDEKINDRPDANIYIYDTTTQKHHPIVIAPGYDGGPFFSPDGKSICYRSDRKGDDLLQIFVADLKFEHGVPVGIEKEYQLTDNEHVNWAPYWHPSGAYLVYGSSEVGHHNYEIFAVEADMPALRRGDKAGNQMRRARITHADGADVLPVFSNDGKFLMWTSQRGPKVEGETRASSQLWIAEVTGSPFEPAR